MTVGIVEPVPEPLRRALRRAVVELARSERRRSFPPVVHTGVPGGTCASFAAGEERLDHALRVDVLEALLGRVRRADRLPDPPLVWLTRPAPIQTEDADLAWLAAARTASAELGRPLRFVTVGRTAWLDPVSGVGRSWPRPPRSPRIRR
jgi:hypothetical protein